MKGAVLLITTVPDENAGEKVAKTLLENRLCACVNIIPGVRSLYWWEGKIQDDKELILFVKTREELAEKVIEKISQVHPYQVPEIIALKLDRVSEPYLKWLFEETAS